MLSDFDFIRRARTGVELLSTLKWLENGNSTSDYESEFGAPYSLFNGPCVRCWVYPREDDQYCRICSSILNNKCNLNINIRNIVVMWGYLNTPPIMIFQNNQDIKKNFHGVYFHDDASFLAMFHRQALLPLLKQITLCCGDDKLAGLIQVFPTTGMERIGMGDILCRAVHYERSYPMDKFRIRFYSHPLQLNNPHIRERNGMLTFDVVEFINILELTTILKSLFTPLQQQDLYQILTECTDAMEQGFLWGRFSRQISEKAKDMLSTWDVKHWHRNKIELIYELINYVAISKPY